MLLSVTLLLAGAEILSVPLTEDESEKVELWEWDVESEVDHDDANDNV